MFRPMLFVATGVALSMGAAPLGCLLVLRRMSLLGDAMAHALLPGAAVGYMIAGLSVTAMGLGGFVAWESAGHEVQRDAHYRVFSCLDTFEECYRV